MPDRRRIVIALGERTTETHCGDCDALGDDEEGFFCGGNHRGLATDAEGNALRSLECRSAEISAAPSGCSCTTQLRNRQEVQVLDRRCPVHGNRSHLTLLPGAKGWARD